MPFVPFSGAVMVCRMQTSATGPLVIQFLMPLMTKSSPSALATVFCAAASRARLRLREREAAEQLARRQRRQELLLLLVGAELVERVAHERVVDAHDDARRGAGARDLLHRQHVADGVEAGAAPLLGHGHAEQAQLGHARHQLLGVPVVAIDLGGLGQHFVLGEVGGGLLHQPLLVGELEVHVSSTYPRIWRGACRGRRACPPSDPRVAKRSANSSAS